MNSSYTQDVEFNSSFDALQTPVHMFTAALLGGAVPPPIDQPFRYLDLACGNGLTLAILAAAYPHAEFVGIDINPDHITKAKLRAEQSALGNVTYFEGDLLDLDHERHGEFDYVAVSGVYSWIDPVRRENTRRFVAAVTRPGGLIYLDYSAQPGMAQTAPLYRILRDLGQAHDGSSAEKLTAAVRFAEQMRRDGARFFDANPIAAARLKSIVENSPEDEAHEVFNLQENGFWSRDVIADMEQQGCAFLASAGLHHNVPLLTGRPDAMRASQHLPVALQQACFDVIWNVHQRRDIFVKGSVESNPASVIASLRDLPYYVMPNALSMEHRRSIAKQLPHYDFTTPAASLLVQCAEQNSHFSGLFSALQMAGVQADQALELVRHFLAARLISIAAAAPVSMIDAQAFRMSSALNLNILIEDIGMEFARPFASPVAGSRLLLPLKDRLYLWGLLGMDLGEVWDRLLDLQDIFRDQQNNILSRETFVQTITNSLPSFRQHIVPELVRLRILLPSESQT